MSFNGSKTNLLLLISIKFTIKKIEKTKEDKRLKE